MPDDYSSFAGVNRVALITGVGSWSWRGAGAPVYEWSG